jgi:iron(III) transport system substrate-binding protein
MGLRGAVFGTLLTVFGVAAVIVPNAKAQAPAEAPVPPAVEPARDVPRLTLYTSFDPHRLAPVLAEFQKASGISVQIETDQADLLLGRLLREGATTAADVVLLPTLTRAERAATAGLFVPVTIPDLDKSIPAAYRDAGGRWIAVTGFVRAAVGLADKVKPADLDRYDDLAKPALKGRLCLPPLGRLASRSFLATQMIPDPLVAEAWLKGVTANAVALPPETAAPVPDAEDRPLVQALVDGKCDVALIGSRTLARLSDRLTSGGGDDPLRPALDKLTVSFPTLGEGRGTPVEVVTIGATQATGRREGAVKLMGYFTSDTGQRLLAEALWGYPLKPGTPLSNPVTRWGPFKADPTPLSQLLPLLPQAAALADRVGGL